MNDEDIIQKIQYYLNKKKYSMVAKEFYKDKIMFKILGTLPLYLIDHHFNSSCTYTLPLSDEDKEDIKILFGNLTRMPIIGGVVQDEKSK